MRIGILIIILLSFMGFMGVVGYFAALKWEVIRLLRRTYARWTPANQWHHGAPLSLVDGKAWVPGPNHDILVSRAAFDLRNGPIRLTGLMPPSGVIWLLALYGNDSRNFFLASDLEHPDGHYDYLLTGPSAKVSGDGATPNAQLIRSTSNRGYAVVRILDDPRVNPSALIDAQRTAVIQPVR